MMSAIPEAPSGEGLSPWWRHSVILTMIGGFTILIWLSVSAYRDAPPIPTRAVGPSGDTIFTREEILSGQEVFLKYGLMENGTIWGHGAYLGPDFSAEYLHTLGLDAREALARERYGQDSGQLTRTEQDLLTAAVGDLLKTNRFDPGSETLVLTDRS